MQEAISDRPVNTDPTPDARRGRFRLSRVAGGKFRTRAGPSAGSLPHLLDGGQQRANQDGDDRDPFGQKTRTNVITMENVDLCVG
jgi:hypothetical protein